MKNDHRNDGSANLGWFADQGAREANYDAQGAVVHDNAPKEKPLSDYHRLLDALGDVVHLMTNYELQDDTMHDCFVAMAEHLKAFGEHDAAHEIDAGLRDAKRGGEYDKTAIKIRHSAESAAQTLADDLTESSKAIEKLTVKYKTLMYARSRPEHYTPPKPVGGVMGVRGFAWTCGNCRDTDFADEKPQVCPKCGFPFGNHGADCEGGDDKPLKPVMYGKISGADLEKKLVQQIIDQMRKRSGIAAP